VPFFIAVGHFIAYNQRQLLLSKKDLTMSMTSSEIRQSFLNFFAERRHTIVPSASLVPGGDQTLLFTNAGMVQFKDVFLGLEKKPYSRAVDSQKCLRVAGKHNDLDDVGRDDYHHTFFEMLGNWSFGDYYKKEAISWAWELLTEKWHLDRTRLWVTCFREEKGEIPEDQEAAEIWKKQPGIDPAHILYFGRKDNFWEMAETGPCGPDSEINYDRGESFCDKKHVANHVCRVNGDCKRFMELWNLVFIQYNRISSTQLIPLAAKHIDTGMGFERVVSIIQNVSSNYQTDLLLPLIKLAQKAANYSDSEVEKDRTPFRVIADHARSAAFLIADGVIPGNIGRNYICRMIIRRAVRFGGKIGLNQPFLSQIADQVIQIYGDHYPELKKNQKIIADNIRREEIRFHRTLEFGLTHLEEFVNELKNEGNKTLAGDKAFELYATHGIPLEITRDILREQNMEVDEKGFQKAMEEHRASSGAGKAFSSSNNVDIEIYQTAFKELIKEKKISPEGVRYDPYSTLETDGAILGIFQDGVSIQDANPGDSVEILLPETCFYLESGGQVSDAGKIVSKSKNAWVVAVQEIRKPTAGIIVHVGNVISGNPKVGDEAIVKVDRTRRMDIMRNHTATHLLHAELHKVLGEHARQAGSLVAPDRLRFDFTHPEALTDEQLDLIESGVNRAILENYPLSIRTKELKQAISEGAMALFGEKYGDEVRTITIGDEKNYSYELCGGTHVEKTGDIGLFIITSEGSIAAGIRRIEAFTGRAAYDLVRKRMKVLKQASKQLSANPEDIESKLIDNLETILSQQKQLTALRESQVINEFEKKMENVSVIKGINILATVLHNANSENLRKVTDLFRQKISSGIVVVGSVIDEKPLIIASVTDDLVIRGIHAGDLVRSLAVEIDGSGGGKPNLAQAGGKNPNGLENAIKKVKEYVEKIKLK
jgi:alanyl-tRNA synthetase